MMNIRVLVLAFAPFILIGLAIFAMPGLKSHLQRRTTIVEEQNLEQHITVDGYNEELVSDPKRGGPIGIRVRFTVHATEPLPMARGGMFVSMGAAEGKEYTNNPRVARLIPADLDGPKAHFAWSHPEPGQPAAFSTTGKNH